MGWSPRCMAYYKNADNCAVTVTSHTPVFHPMTGKDFNHLELNNEVSDFMTTRRDLKKNEPLILKYIRRLLNVSLHNSTFFLLKVKYSWNCLERSLYTQGGKFAASVSRQNLNTFLMTFWNWAADGSYEALGPVLYSSWLLNPCHVSSIQWHHHSWHHPETQYICDPSCLTCLL